VRKVGSFKRGEGSYSKVKSKKTTKYIAAEICIKEGKYN